MSDQPSSDQAGSAGRPLDGKVVLDLTQFLAGPFATQILADLGARVIKVEPFQGDSSRTIPPHFIAGSSAYFHSTNRNKESIAVDLKTVSGVQLVLDLVAKADLVIENFRPGVLDKLGLGFEHLCEVKPDVLLCSISGFGQDGPYRNRPAYDLIVQALSGGMSITGEQGGNPVRAGVPLGDLVAGLFAVIGSLAHLSDADRRGPRHIDVSMLDAQIPMLSYQAIYYLVSGEVPGPQGRGHVSIPTYRSFACGDGSEIVITANTERMWQALCGVLDRKDLLEDVRFETNSSRLTHRAPLWDALEAAFLRRDADEWLTLMQDSGIPAAPVNTIDKALSDVQVHHRDMIVDVEAQDGTPLRLVGNPIKTVGAPDQTYRPPPLLGEQGRSILRELLELDDDAVDALVVAGVVSEAVAPPGAS